MKSREHVLIGPLSWPSRRELGSAEQREAYQAPADDARPRTAGTGARMHWLHDDERA